MCTTTKQHNQQTSIPDNKARDHRAGTTQVVPPLVKTQLSSPHFPPDRIFRSKSQIQLIKKDVNIAGNPQQVNELLQAQNCHG